MNAVVHRAGILSALFAAALLLTAVAWLRSAEYDEQYTLFLTGGTARPDWPAETITAGQVRALQSGQPSFAGIARDLRTTDVHPPLYFWVVAAWRMLTGDSLFAVRLASVLCGTATLCLVAVIARTTGIPAAPAVLLTVGCYGFAYTGAIARGFALAQLLNVAGVAALLAARRRPSEALLAGALLGAATFTNYLAAFVGCAALACPSSARRRTLVLAGFAIWLPADLWFFWAQRGSRVEQFEPFEPVAAVVRLVQYAAANLFGGLPLYADGPFRILIGMGLIAISGGIALALVRRWRCIAVSEIRTLFAGAAIAPAIGLLMLGLTFNNTPVELRYLAFATPFVGLLLAAALPQWLRLVVLSVQAIALLGLITRPETMQPARAAALAAASLAGDGVVLLPHGNDGVGVVGAFAVEAPPSLRLLIVRPDASPEQIHERAAPFSRVVLVLLGQDRASRAALPLLRRSFSAPCWRAAGEATNVLAFERDCAEGCRRAISRLRSSEPARSYINSH